MNRFYKVSFDEFKRSADWMDSDSEIRAIYDDIKLPKQATPGSAGHDFFSPIDFTLVPDSTVKIPTGIRVRLDDYRVLAIFPRSGLGFKYRLQLDNTVGIIDSDYIGADNEGHIMIKLTNDSRYGKAVSVKKGEAFAQGIILTYEIAEGAAADQDKVRTGGFGSTTHGEAYEFGASC